MPVTKLRPTFTFTEERLAELKAVVPEAFADGQINWETLREALGNYLEGEGDAEHFGLFWPGKRAARRLAAMPSKGTLIPAPGEGVNEDSTRNVFIEGDNLEVLKIIQKSYAGRVKLIYIDPPYNTGNDFVYKDDFRDPLEDYLRKTGQTSEAGELLTSNPQVGGRYHSNWLNMIYPRLLLARQLLSETGLIIVSIDDHEVHHLRQIMNEIFGEESLIGALIWKRRQQVDSRTKDGLSVDHEYALVYKKSPAARLRGAEKDLTKYSNPDNDPRGPWASDNLVGLATKEQRPNLHYVLIDPTTGNKYPCTETGWRYSKTTMAELIADGRILWPASPTGRPRLKRFLHELKDAFTGQSTLLNTAYSSEATRELKEIFDGKDVMDFPKPVEYIKTLIKQAADEENSIVLDFFAGSCTTAQAVLELNREGDIHRQFIMIQLPEPSDRPHYPTIAEIGKERIRRVIRRMSKKEGHQLPLRSKQSSEDKGFRVFKLVRSNYRAWQDYTGEDVEQLEMIFENAETPLVKDWTPEGLLTEIMLLEGFPLDSTVTEQSDFEHNTVQLVESDACAHRLWVCFDKKIKDQTLERLQPAPEDILICLDSALTDEAKVRLSDTGNLHVI